MTQHPTSQHSARSDVVTIPVPDPDGPTEMRGYLAAPDDGQEHPAVIVLQELFGVNADIRSVVDALAAAGYVAVAPEIYHRTAPASTVFAKDDAGRTAGFGHVNALTRDQGVADVAAASAYLTSRPDTSGTVSVIGFSLGGHLAYLAATQLDLDSVTALYAGWLPTTGIPLSQPDPTLTLTPGIAAHGGRVLILVGEADHVVSAADLEATRAALEEADVRHEVVTYPGVGHAFFWEGAAYDARARADAWARALSHLSAD